LKSLRRRANSAAHDDGMDFIGGSSAMANRRGRDVRSDARLPDFIAIGPTRTATTWLHGVLYHRACLPAGIKETRFFDMFYSKGLDWYLEYFRGCPDERPRGEISPAYFRSSHARERIANDIPSCKIICTLREPVARVYSQYRMLQRQGLLRDSFETEVRTNENLVEASRYGHHLRAWYERFGRAQVGVFFYDDLEADEQKFADAICRFIGVPPIVLTPETARFLDRNEATYASRNRLLAYNARRLRFWLQEHHATWASKVLDGAGIWRFCAGGGDPFPPLDPEVERRLREYFLPEVEAVEELTNRDLSAWKPGGGNFANASLPL
jgi:Sulfotransferase domain